MTQPAEVIQDDAAHPPHNKRSDGSTERPLIVVPPEAVTVRPTPGAPNAALKEAPPANGDGFDGNHKCAAHLVIVDVERGLVAMPNGAPRRKKFAICGFASQTRKYMPVHDDTWEIWTLNQLYRHVPRSDVHFDIHYNWNDEVVPGTDHRVWARACGIPFYMMQRQPDVPTSIRFPIDAIIAHFEADYFTSTIAYMVALAVWEIDAAVRTAMHEWVVSLAPAVLATQDVVAAQRACYQQYTIGLFGIDLVVGEEYFWQKACAEFWIGLASGRGIQMLIPPESALCKQQYRYGYDREPQQFLKVSDIETHVAEVAKQRDEHIKRLWMMEGALQDADRFKQIIELRSRGATV